MRSPATTIPQSPTRQRRPSPRTCHKRLPRKGEISNKPLPVLSHALYTFETRGSYLHEKDKVRAMPVSRQVDLLEPIDLAEHLEKIELYLGQVCQIAGISKMQLDYWTNKAQIPTKGKKQRIYDIDALETVMLIKQAKDKGLNLGAAIEAARSFRELRTNGALL